MNLAPPLGAALDERGVTLKPPAPPGWTWHPFEGTFCRDGSQNGLYVRRGSARKLLIYLEGGGACSTSKFCEYNPARIDEVLSGDDSTVLSVAGGVVAGRQQPGLMTEDGEPSGIFDSSNPRNPVRDWNQVYIPYCTGDVHFGTKPDTQVSGLASKQQFVGYSNMQKFIGRLVPTFKDAVDQVALVGASAGSFAATLNYSMVQDAFAEVPVSLIADSGPFLGPEAMTSCLQQRWRDSWGFDGALPPDCAECEASSKSGVTGLYDFLLKKHPNARIALLSSMSDEMIRLFLSPGLANCANFDSAEPLGITLGQLDSSTYMPARTYERALMDLRTKYASSGRWASYYMTGSLHQNVFRTRLFSAPAGGKTMSQFIADFLTGRMQQVGP